MSTGTNLIEIKGLRKIFPGRNGKSNDLLVLNNINLSIKENEFISLIGPSGCGKTTLLKMIDGLLSQDGGEITIKGKRVTGPGSDRGMVFQSFSLLPWATILSNVAFGLEIKKVPKKEREERAMDMLKVVGLQDFAHHYPK